MDKILHYTIEKRITRWHKEITQGAAKKEKEMKICLREERGKSSHMLVMIVPES